MSLYVAGIVVSDVLKGYTAFIFRVKQCKGKCGFVYVETYPETPAWLYSVLDCLTLKMKAL